jgi:hypothetical protein
MVSGDLQNRMRLEPLNRSMANEWRASEFDLKVFHSLAPIRLPKSLADSWKGETRQAI